MDKQKLEKLSKHDLIKIIESFNESNSFVLKALNGRDQIHTVGWLGFFNPLISTDVEFSSIHKHLITAVLVSCNRSKGVLSEKLN